MAKIGKQTKPDRVSKTNEKKKNELIRSTANESELVEQLTQATIQLVGTPNDQKCLTPERPTTPNPTVSPTTGSPSPSEERSRSRFSTPNKYSPSPSPEPVKRTSITKVQQVEAPKLTGTIKQKAASHKSPQTIRTVPDPTLATPSSQKEEADREIRKKRESMSHKYYQDTGKIPKVTILNAHEYNMADLNKEFHRRYKPLTYTAALIRGKTQISLSTYQNYVQLLTFLDSKGVEFALIKERQKTSDFVIRGVPPSVGSDMIALDLERLGINAIKVSNMHSASGIKFPLYKVSVPTGPEAEHISKLTTLCYYTIKVETYRLRRLPPQCTRCQQYHHTIETCRNSPRCRFCAGEHLTRSCRQPRDANPVCVLCNENHCADSQECAHFKAVIENSRRRPPHQKTTDRQTKGNTTPTPTKTAIRRPSIVETPNTTTVPVPKPSYSQAVAQKQTKITEKRQMTQTTDGSQDRSRESRESANRQQAGTGVPPGVDRRPSSPKQQRQSRRDGRSSPGARASLLEQSNQLQQSARPEPTAAEGKQDGGGVTGPRRTCETTVTTNHTDTTVQLTERTPKCPLLQSNAESLPRLTDIVTGILKQAFPNPTGHRVIDAFVEAMFNYVDNPGPDALTNSINIFVAKLILGAAFSS